MKYIRWTLFLGHVAWIVTPLQFAQDAQAKRGKSKRSSRVKASKAGDDNRTLVYSGKLQDSDRKPIGGIFPLTFSLHKSPKRGKSVWSESHFVAVENGRYDIVLGSKRPINAKLGFSRIYLAVSVTGGDEIMRDRLKAEVFKQQVQPALPGVGSNVPLVRRPAAAPAGGGSRTVDYAERAGEALLAQHAQKADKLGDMSLNDLLARIKRQGRGSKVSIGTKVRYTQEAGGTGGFEKDLLCPKGHVVTGLKARSGKFIDSVQLICSPLE